MVAAWEVWERRWGGGIFECNLREVDGSLAWNISATVLGGNCMEHLGSAMPSKSHSMWLHLSPCLHNHLRPTFNIISCKPRAALHHAPWSRTTEDGPFPWSDFSVQLLWSNILTNQCIKSSGLSLGVNQMWTKRNDHAPENRMCWFFNFNIHPKGGNFEEWNQVWSFFCLLVSSSSLLPQKKHFHYCNDISLSWVSCLFLPEHLFCLSHCKARWTMSVDNVGLHFVFWGPQTTCVFFTRLWTHVVKGLCKEVRYVGVSWFHFFIFSNFYWLDSHNKTRVALANLH